jgi:hypothetical protein
MGQGIQPIPMWPALSLASQIRVYKPAAVSKTYLQPRCCNDYMGKIVMVQVATGILLSLAPPAISANPYVDIVQRNVFGLREPVVPVPPAAAPVPQDTSELVLTGIVDFRTAKWALLTRTERGKPPLRYTLTVGQKEENLEVLAIDAVSATVQVRYDGKDIVLSFESHGPPTERKLEDLSRKYVQQSKPFVDEHTRAHALREQREAERRAVERAAAAAELASREISTHMDEPRL